MTGISSIHVKSSTAAVLLHILSVIKDKKYNTQTNCQQNKVKII